MRIPTEFEEGRGTTCIFRTGILQTKLYRTHTNPDHSIELYTFPDLYTNPDHRIELYTFPDLYTLHDPTYTCSPTNVLKN